MRDCAVTWLRWLLAAFAISIGSAQAQDAADYPSRTVRLIVPSSAGGPVDAVARILADGFKTVWKEPVVVESKPGAGNSTARCSSPMHRRMATRC